MRKRVGLTPLVFGFLPFRPLVGVPSRAPLQGRGLSQNRFSRPTTPPRAAVLVSVPLRPVIVFNVQAPPFSGAKRTHHIAAIFFTSRLVPVVSVLRKIDPGAFRVLSPPPAGRRTPCTDPLRRSISGLLDTRFAGAVGFLYISAVFCRVFPHFISP